MSKLSQVKNNDNTSRNYPHKKIILRMISVFLLVIVVSEFGILMILMREEMSTLTLVSVNALTLAIVLVPVSYFILYRPAIMEFKQVLHHSEDRFRSFVESATDAVVGTNSEGKISFWNEAAEGMFGYSCSAAIGREVNKIIFPVRTRPKLDSEIKQIRDYIERDVTGKTYEFTAMQRDGIEFPVELTFSAYKYGGEWHSMSFIRDISKRRKVKRELQAFNQRLRKRLISTIHMIVRAAEARDPYTAGHQGRVSHLAREIAQKMDLDNERVEGIRLGAMVHDIGKIQVPSEILSKPGKLSAHEFELVKEHSMNGYNIMKDVEFPWPISQIARQHHERLDGSGYPEGLKGDDICLEAKIVAVADVVEAISSHRPYRPSLGVDVALEEIKKGSGRLFDPEVVNACLKIFDAKGFSFDAAQTGTIQDDQWDAIYT